MHLPDRIGKCHGEIRLWRKLPAEQRRIWMKKELTTAIVCAAFSIMAPAALAQAQAPAGGERPGLEQRPGFGGQQRHLEVPAADELQPGRDKPQRSVAPHEWQRPGPAGEHQALFRAKNLIGRQVQTTQGENLGRLTEIVFHPEVGIFAVVELDSKRLAPLPWAMVERLTGEQVVVSGTSKALLQGAPLIEDQQWDRLNDPAFTQKIYTYHGLEAQAGVGSPGKSPSGTIREQGERQPHKQP
jgi:sporulation protein YlmC with PRC-barrel domain